MDRDQDDRQEPIVRLVRLRKRFGQLRVLRGLSLDVAHGRATVVLGPSGCGKSVMLKHVIGLLRPDSGEVWFDGTRLDTLTEMRLAPARQQFGFLFQHGALFDSMTVADNVAFPLAEHTRLSTSEQRHRVREVLDMVGLDDTLDKMPSDLSGGQRKRVALARAIVLKPRVILYDEPTTGLDPVRADAINDLILMLQARLDVTSIVVTHDLTSAFKVADHMVMLHHGVVVTEGPPAAFRRSTDPIVQRFLRGDASQADLDADDAAQIDRSQLTESS